MTSGTITRTLEPNLTFFSAAELRVVVLPIGEIPDDVFQRYTSLIMTHRKVELNNVRSFYKESQKSPFKFFPWKSGNMHFRFLPEEAAAIPNPLASLHAHRRVLGVLGVLSCPHTSDIARRYKEFEQRCRAFGDATTIRCFAFNPSDAQITEDHKSAPDLVLFPPGDDGGTHLEHHMEVVMHDFAACVLGALESWMLNSSPAMVPMASLVDSPEFTGSSVAPYAGEDEGTRTKRKYARLQKAMGDYSLLAGSPLDALDHYNTSAELGRLTSDLTYTAAALEGYATAKLLHAAVSNDAFVSNSESVFNNEEAWRTPTSAEALKHGEGEEEEEVSSKPPGSVGASTRGGVDDDADGDSRCQQKGGGGGGASGVEGRSEFNAEGTATPDGTATPCQPPLPRPLTTPTRVSMEIERQEKSDTVSFVDNSSRLDDAATPAVIHDDTSCVKSDPGSIMTATSSTLGDPCPAFSGKHFWTALRQTPGLEDEIRALVEESKDAIRRRGGLPLLVETDIKWARLLAGLHGPGARGAVAELAAGIQLAAELLPLPEDRLVALTEAASALGSVGAVRKRVLLMWQAVELSKYFGFPDARTLAVARKALEPAVDPQNRLDHDGDYFSSPPPLSQETAISASWGLVRAGCLEATLGLAIYAKRHGDVWDAAAALLREHSASLSPHRMQSLLDNLMASASHMGPKEKARPGRGPPPLIYYVMARDPPGALRPRYIEVSPEAPPQSPAGQRLFLYDPFADKRKARKYSERRKSAAGFPDFEADFDSRRGHHHGAREGRGTTRDHLGVLGFQHISFNIHGGEGGVAEGSMQLSQAAWPCGEPAVVDIEISNPSSVAIKIDKMVLDAYFQGRPSTRAEWKAKPVSINIPAYTKPVRIQLEGTPFAPGTLLLRGCRLTAFGGVSWVQPWSIHPPSMISTLGIGRHGGSGRHPSTLNDAVMETKAMHAGTPLPRKINDTEQQHPENLMPSKSCIWYPCVSVVPPMPRLELTLRNMSYDPLPDQPPLHPARTPHRRTTTGLQQSPRVSLSLLHGQTLATSVVLSNVGSIPAGMARVGVEHAGRLLIALDTGPLESALPLCPGDSVRLPINISTTMQPAKAQVARGAAGMSAGTDPTVVSIQLEYAAGSEDGTGQDTHHAHSTASLGNTTTLNPTALLGRHVVLDAAITVHPSVQVASVSFREIFVASPASNPSAKTCQRCALMCAVVVNRGPIALDVWMEMRSDACANIRGDHGNRTDHEGAISCQDDGRKARVCGEDDDDSRRTGGPVVCILPEQRATVELVLNPDDPLVETSASAFSVSHAGAAYVAPFSFSANQLAGRGNNRPLRHDEVERQACAAWLATCTSLRFAAALSGEDQSQSDASRIVDTRGGNNIEEETVVAAGCLPLVQGEVYNGLSRGVLSMLRACSARAHLSVQRVGVVNNGNSSMQACLRRISLRPRMPVHQGGHQPRRVLTPAPNENEDEGDDDDDDNYNIYALPVAVGRTAKVILHMENVTDEHVVLSGNLSCRPVQWSANGNKNTGHFDALTSDSVNPSGASVAYDPTMYTSHTAAAAAAAAPAVGLAAWTGVHSNLDLHMAPKGKVEHIAGLTVTAPGLYKISLDQATCCQAQGATAVSPQLDDMWNSMGLCAGKPQTQEGGVWYNNGPPQQQQQHANYQYQPGYYPPTGQPYPQQAGYPPPVYSQPMYGSPPPGYYQQRPQGGIGPGTAGVLGAGTGFLGGMLVGGMLNDGWGGHSSGGEYGGGAPIITENNTYNINNSDPAGGYIDNSGFGGFDGGGYDAGNDFGGMGGGMD